MCPLYAAEKKRISSLILKFGNLIVKNSNTQVIIIKDEIDLANYFKKNLINNEIVIGMGAGIISKWMTKVKNLL